MFNFKQREYVYDISINKFTTLLKLMSVLENYLFSQGFTFCPKTYLKMFVFVLF